MLQGLKLQSRSLFILPQKHTQGQLKSSRSLRKHTKCHLPPLIQRCTSCYGSCSLNSKRKKEWKYGGGGGETNGCEHLKNGTLPSSLLSPPPFQIQGAVEMGILMWACGLLSNHHLKQPQSRVLWASFELGSYGSWLKDAGFPVPVPGPALVRKSWLRVAWRVW